MRVLVFGAGGQVGCELLPLLEPFAEVTALGRGDVSLEDDTAVRRAIGRVEPAVIVNLASYNDVDGAEREEEKASAINGRAVLAMGEEAERNRAVLLHFSSDFVFDGKASRPYREDDTTAPLSAYGRSKLLGERLLADAGLPAIVLRTAWVYSVGKMFMRSILVAAREREVLRVVDDQVGSPTAARDLAIATALILRGAHEDPFAVLAPARGVFHIAGAGQASRHELACAILALDPLRDEHVAREVVAIKSAELTTPATRPAFAPLDSIRIRDRFGISLPPWRTSVARVLADLQKGRLGPPAAAARRVS